MEAVLESRRFPFHVPGPSARMVLKVEDALSTNELELPHSTVISGYLDFLQDILLPLEGTF